MLSREKNELLTRTGPGTPMGTLLRRYWCRSRCPWSCRSRTARRCGCACSASSSSPSATPAVGRPAAGALRPPRRLALLRPQRGMRAPLHLPRLEVRRQRQLRGHDERARGARLPVQDSPAAYPTMELGGLVWTYMGPPEQQPPLPRFAWALVPESHRHVYKTWQECNWLQAWRAASTRRTRISCTGACTPPTPDTVSCRRRPSSARAPRLEVYPHEHGYMYAGVRSLDDDQVYVRTYHYVLPFTQIRPGPSTWSSRTTPATSGSPWTTRTAWSTTGPTVWEPSLCRRRTGAGAARP